MPEPKYNEDCALCGGKGTDKKYLGQFWHKKCLRGVKKQSKKML
jgi:reverse gyrase